MFLHMSVSVSCKHACKQNIEEIVIFVSNHSMYLKCSRDVTEKHNSAAHRCRTIVTPSLRDFIESHHRLKSFELSAVCKVLQLDF